jgi:S1-C subfamily serine protease
MGRLAIFLLLMAPPSSPEGSDYDPAYHSDVYRFSEQGLKNAYNSSVIITSASPMAEVAVGSGNYFHIHGHRFILTAAHVIPNDASIVITERSGLNYKAEVVLMDQAVDLAILKVEKPLRFTEPIDYRPSKRVDVGKEVFYCGQPNMMYFTTYEGRVSGTSNQYLLVDTFAWPGSSGSVLFDKSGRTVGIISAVSMDAPTGVPVLIPNLVRVGPVSSYTRNDILEILLNECPRN